MEEDLSATIHNMMGEARPIKLPFFVIVREIRDCCVAFSGQTLVCGVSCGGGDSETYKLY